MTRRPRPARGVWLAALLAITACSAETDRSGTGRSETGLSENYGEVANAGTPRRSILLITLCTFRYAHMGAAGYDRPTTPFLDSLGARGLFYENAVSASSWTKPATASILTGLTPGVHGMTDFYEPDRVEAGRIGPVRVLADEVTTLAETLRHAGYATAAAINNVHVSEHFNMIQGFDTAVVDKRLDAARMVEVFGDWLGTVPADEPFFFFLMSRDPHVTFDPRYEGYLAFNRSETTVAPEDYRKYVFAVRRSVLKALEIDEEVPPDLKTQYIDLYDAELAQQDAALALLPLALERAGRADTTVIVVTADHGEHFFEHGLVGHGPARLDETVVHIPLIFAGPGIPAGVRDGSLVRSIDLFPTLAALAGTEGPDVLQGRDLLADPDFSAEHARAKPGEPADDGMGAFATVYDNEHMVRRGNLSFYLRKDGAHELFDLSQDRDELRDLSTQLPEQSAELHTTLRLWLERERELQNRVSRGDARRLEEDAVEALRELGYIQ